MRARCEVIVKNTNCNLLEHESIRTVIRTLDAQFDEKNKNIKARQNVAGSYKKSSVVFKYDCLLDGFCHTLFTFLPFDH